MTGQYLALLYQVRKSFHQQTSGTGVQVMSMQWLFYHVTRYRLECLHVTVNIYVKFLTTDGINQQSSPVITRYMKLVTVQSQTGGTETRQKATDCRLSNILETACTVAWHTISHYPSSDTSSHVIRY